MFQGIKGAITLAILDYIYIFVVLGSLAIIMIFTSKAIQFISKPKMGINLSTQDDKSKSLPQIKNIDKSNGGKSSYDILRERAAITAAIASYLNEFNIGKSYRVISIKQTSIGQLTPWKLSQKHFPSVKVDRKYKII